MHTQKHFYKIIFALFIVLSACTNNTNQEAIFTVEEAKESLLVAEKHYLKMAETLNDSVLPRTTGSVGELETSNIYWWTSGFYPGTLWYLYEYTGNDTLKEEAEQKTNLLEPLKEYPFTHDLGFMVFCSYGNAYRITGNSDYKEIIIEAAETLASRYNDTIKTIKSWDWNRDGEWQFPVIIDNMMNLEMLTWAAHQSDNKKLEDVANIHSKTTIENHFREDFSTYHVVDYDTITGQARGRMTHQGYSDESAWARGQAWGLYGYVMMFDETGDSIYLNQAQEIADFILEHENLPEDKIPYWDFNAPDIPDALRDASAGAIIASALLELSTFTTDTTQAKYLENAETMLATLSSDNYLAEPGSNNNFILKHSVGHLPGESEVDVPLTYADYYYVEALLRFLELKGDFSFEDY